MPAIASPAIHSKTDSLSLYKAAMAAHAQGHLLRACRLYEQALERQATLLQTTEQQIVYRPIDTELLQTLLFTVLTGLHQHGLSAFATGGSLLGLTREGRILPTDKDIDIALPVRQMAAAGQWLTQQGWQRQIHMPQLVNPQAWLHHSGIPLDLVGYQAQQDHVISGFWYHSSQHPWSRVTHVPRVTLIEQTHPFGSYWHPQDPSALLDVLFGKDWRTPNPHYDSLLHTNTLQDFSLITRCYALKRIYWHWITRAFDKASAMIEKCLCYNSTDTLCQTLLGAIQNHRAKTLPSHSSQEPPMPTIKIDNKDYDLDSLSDEARAQLTSLQFVDAEIARLQALTAVFQTARMAYAQELAALNTLKPPCLQIAAPVANPHPPIAALLPPDAPKVLLVTHQWSTLVEMPYLVKQASCHVDVLCPSNNSTLKNSFYDHWIDAGATMETLLTTLHQLASAKTYDYILVGDDPILWAIYRHQLTDLYPLLPILNPAALPILNKVGFAQHCHQHGIASPRFYPVAQYSEADTALQALGLPVVVKENYSNGGAGVRIFQDAASYQAFMSTYDYAEPLLAQQFIAGELLGVEALYKNGRLLQYASVVVLEADLGPSTKRRYMHNDERVADILSQLGHSATLHGFVNISLMQEATSQRYYLFEADPRPTRWVPYAKWFGCDFVPAFQAFMAAGDTDTVQPTRGLEQQHIECWDVEYFPSYAAKLLNAGRTTEAILHLLDFQKNWRYTLYDPVLLQDRLDCIRRGIKFG